MLPRILWVWGDVDLDRIRFAKERLALPYRCVPREIPGGDIEARVLAWGTRPPYVCAYAFVTDETPDDQLQRMLAWALYETEDDEPMTVEDSLAAELGRGVREIPAEELEAERRLAEYEAG